MIKLIVAKTKQNLIGFNNKMPWYIKEELNFFKETTKGHAILMGRKTLDNIASSLPGRKLYCFGRSESNKADAINITSEEKLMDLFEDYKNSSDILFIAGGKFVYEKYYKFANEIIISVIKGDEYEGDTYLNLDLEDYEITKEEDYQLFTVYHYKNKGL